MADTEYRSFIGRMYAGPFERQVTTQGGAKTVREVMLSGPGVNGDVEIKASFWDDLPEYVQTGVIVFISGKFSTYEGKNKDGDSKITKTINVNFCEKLGQNSLVRSAGNAAPVKRQKPKAAEADIEDLLGEF